MSDRTNIITENNRDALRRLTRVVQMAQGFSLSIALCNYEVLQKRVLQELRSHLAEHGLTETAIAFIDLEPNVLTMLTAIQDLMAKVERLQPEQRPKILMILGLEQVKEIVLVLKSANRVREEFANCLEFPMVLWLNDRTQDILNRNAPDLANWATAGAIAFQFTPAELLELLKVSTEAMFDRFLESRDLGFLRAPIANGLQQFELMTAVEEIKTQGLIPDEALQANLDFAFGCIDFGKSELEKAKILFQQSLAVWQDRDLLKQAVCLLQLGMCDRMSAFRSRYEKEAFYRSSRQYLTQSLAIFRQLERWDLVAEYINFLMAAVEDLAGVKRSPPAPLIKGGESGLYRELEGLALEAIALRERYPSLLKEAHDRGILAVVKLAEGDYAAARQFVESALAMYRQAETEKLPNLRFSERYLYGKYELWLAKTLAGLGDRALAIAGLEGVRKRWQYQYDTQIYVSILEELRSLYTAEGLYWEAFQTKQYQRSIEQQYGLRAFIGAGVLNPKREANTPDMYTVISDRTDGIAQEIEASGRRQDIEALVDRIRQPRFPLTVMHGDSGAGKSSILKGGVVPALRAKETLDGRRVLVLMVNSYKDWSGDIKAQLHKFFANTRPDLNPIEHFKRNIDENYLTVLVFDQFEDFFFKKEDLHDRLPFYKFLKACLHTDYVRVVLALREDYLHYLLECDRAVDLEKVENDILGKSVRYYLGDFTPAQARQAIASLTARAQVRLDDDLCDRLVADLTGDRGRVLPIELQVVGAQLESEEPVITTLAQYLALTSGAHASGALVGGDRSKPNLRKPSEVLVERWLENVVKDCGEGNAELAQRVLYALTGTEEKRPQKTLEELAMELLTSPPSPLSHGERGSKDSFLLTSPKRREAGGEVNLELVLSVLVGSGLAFRVSGMPEDRFQLIHDYLTSFIRKKYGINLGAELIAERQRREKAELEKEVLAVANRKAGRMILVGSIFLGVAIVAAVGISFYAGKAFQDSQEAIAITQIEKQSAEAERLFKTQEFQALLPAVRAAKRLKAIVKDSQQIEQYPSVSPLGALQLILRNGRENLQFRATSIAFSPDGKQVLTSGSDGTVRIWNLQGNQIAILKRHQGSFFSVVFSNDGTKQAMSGSNGTARIWDLQSKEIANLRGHQGDVWSIVFSNDGTKLATGGSDGTARIWDLQGNQIGILKGHQRDVNSVVFSNDGMKLATGGSDGTARIWDLQGNQIGILKGHQRDVWSVVFSNDGTKLATGGRDGTARIWDLQGNQIGILKGHQRDVLRVVFSKDGTKLATGGSDGTVRIWDLQGNQIGILKGHQGDVWSVVFSNDGTKLATSGRDRTARIWDLQDNQIEILKGHQRDVNSVVFSNDGMKLATGGSDGTARIWDLQGNQIGILKGHQRDVWSVVFSNDGTKLATSGSDGTTRIWDLQGRQIAEYEGYGILSKDFQFIATIPKDAPSVVKLWRIQTLDEMLVSACARLRPYLTTNPDVSESDKRLCD